MKQTRRQLQRKKWDAEGQQIHRERKGKRPPSSAVRPSASSLKSQMLEALLLVRCRWMQELLSCLFVRAGQYSVRRKPADPGRGAKRGEEKRNLILGNNFCSFTENSRLQFCCQ